MKRATWNKLNKLRGEYRETVDEIARRLPGLRELQQKLVDSRAGGKAAYTVETPVLYNFALDDIAASDDIRLLLVADNPGRREQAAENRRYLVGPSGKIAGRFFSEHPALGIDFRKNVIILNKTPLHTPRTAELRELCRMDSNSGAVAQVLAESQRKMAQLLFEFHRCFAPLPVWMIGYSEMKKGGIFETYTETLRELYKDSPLREQLLLFRHFSMNQFTVDLNRNSAKKETVAETLQRIGSAYRNRFLGW